MPRFVSSLVVALALLLPAAARAQSPAPAAPTVPDPAGTVIVRYAPGVDQGDRGETRSEAGVHRAEVLPLDRAELVDPDPGVGVAEAVRALERDPDVLYAEPNAPRDAYSTPNDTYFPMQWALRNTGQSVNGQGGTPGADINAPAAWDTTTGSRSVVVGVIDTGAELTHPDLAANIWHDPGESGPGQATNGRDDDGNGYVDDADGWNFVDDDGHPVDAEGHGTHVAGTIGAQGGNAAGVTGVAQTSSLMILQALDAQGSGTVADVISAYAYAARNGARVVNASLGGSTFSQAEHDALAAAGNVLFVVAAGNDGANNDVTGAYPCDYDLPNVVCVAASDRNDALATFSSTQASNYGAHTVDLAAPGVDIASTYLGGRYAFMQGTSMATPQVTGVAALALARNPALTVAQLRGVLLSSVDPEPGLAGKTVTGGRVDAARAVTAAGAVVGAPPATAGTPAAPPAVAPAPATAARLSVGSPQPAASSPPSQTPPPAPTPKPATAPARVTPADRTAPGLTVGAARSQRSRALRTAGLRVTATCSEACRLSATLTLETATARRLGLSGRRVAVATRASAPAGKGILVLRLSAAARARLHGSGRAVLRVEAFDAAGNHRTRLLTVALRG